MKTSDFIKYLQEAEGDLLHFQETFQEYGISIVDENEYKDQGLWLYKDQGLWLYHRRGVYFSLGGKNMSCMLEWMFRNIKAEAVAATKNNCRENFKKNLLKMLD